MAQVSSLPRFSDITEGPTSRATRDQLVILNTRYELATRYAASKDVLEVACGAGVGLGMLARVSRRTIGGDIDASNCAIAQETYRDRPEIEIKEFAAEELPFPDKSFDLILLYEALYYLKSVDAFIQEVRRVLRPGGTLLLSTVNCRWRGFNPSPFSTKYYDAAELAAMLHGHDFDFTLYAGFPEKADGALSGAVALVRKIAVSLHLIPRTQKSKEWLKRIFCGELQPIPRELQAGSIGSGKLDTLAPPFTADEYRFIYAVATPREQ